MLTRVLLVILLMCPFSLRAQLQGSDGQSNLSDMTSGQSMFRSFDNRFKGVEGTPLLLEQYVPGKIVLTGGRVVEYPQVNYDAYSNELLVKRNNAEMVVTKSMVKEFALLQGSDSLRFVKVPQAGGQFYQLLTKGKYSLYKKNLKTIRAANNTGAYSSGKTSSSFEESARFYWQIEEEAPREIKNRKTFVGEVKELLKINLDEFIKKGKIDFKEEEDMARMFDYLNTL